MCKADTLGELQKLHKTLIKNRLQKPVKKQPHSRIMQKLDYHKLLKIKAVEIVNIDITF